MKLVENEKIKSIFYYSNFDEKILIFFNILIKEKLCHFFDCSYNHFYNINNNFNFQKYQLFSRKTLLLLTTVFKNFFVDFSKYFKINKKINSKNCIDIHDIILSLNFCEFFNSVEEIFFFGKLKYRKRNNYIYAFKKNKINYFNNNYAIFSIKKKREKKKNNFYSGFRFFNPLKYKYMYRINYFLLSN